MIAELICVGTELLLGNIVNTNAAYLSEQLAALGISCYFQSVVGDNAERLAWSIRTAMERAHIVILSGGLGPTEDDLTKEIAAEVCGRKLLLHEPSRAAIEGYFVRRGIQATANNWKQAMLPEGCIVMENRNGTAPGVIMEEEGTKVLLFPGPPNELKPMFEQSAVPYLKSLTSTVICSRTVKVLSVGESKAETMIRDLIDAQSNPTIATYAKTGQVDIRVTASAESEEQADALLAPVVDILLERFGSDVFTTQEKTTLEEAVVEMLRERGLTLTCAESCTGGMLSAAIVGVPGVSEVYQAGVVTYANEAKQKLIGVPGDIIATYDAVSAETAEAMVRGVCQLTGADAGLSITGIAGPDGGTEEKPVGLVYIGCKVRENVVIKRYQFSGNRMKIRTSAVVAALTLLRNTLLNYK